MESNREKGRRILFEREQRTSMEKGQCFYIKNTQTQVRELFCRTADNSGVDRGSPIRDKETQARESQHVDKLNKRIKYELGQLKFLRRNIIQNSVESKASESKMELHDKEVPAEQSSDESQSRDTGDQRLNESRLRSSQKDIKTLSCRTVGHTNKRYKRAEGGCNYLPRQKNKCRDLEPRSVYQCDYGNTPRCITCFAGAQQQFHDDRNCVCCTLRPSVPIPIMPSPCCQYQPSWACFHTRPFNPRTTTDLNTEDFCRNWCACVVPDRAQKLKHKSHRASEEPSGSKSRSSSKGSRALDEKIRSKLKKSGATIDSSSLDQYKVESHEKLLKVTMRKESKSKSAARKRGSKSQAVEGKPKTEGKEMDEQADNTKNDMYLEYMEKYKKENRDDKKEQRKAGEGSQLESNPTYTRIPDIKREPGESKYDNIVSGKDPIFTADKKKEPACLDSCPEVNCKPPQSAYEERGACDKEKCDCVGQKDKTEAEYKYQRPAQDDGREPKSGKEGVCLDSCPGGTCKPPQSAYGEGVPISTADKTAERGEAVSHKEKCACVTQEVQTDDELVKKETRLTQTDLKLQEEQLTQTDLQGSRHERPTQTDMGGSRLDILTKNDLQGSQHERKPPQSACDEGVPISTPDKRGERGKAVCQKKKCACVSQEVQTDGEYTYQRPAQDDGRDPRAEKKGVFLDSCPGVTGKPPQSAYDERDQMSTSDKRAERGKGVCRNKKCACLLQELLADGKYTDQRGPAQGDGSEPKSGQKGGVPGVTGKPPQAAYDDQVSISTPDKTVERGRAVCQKKKCACVSQEVETDGEYTYQRPAQDDGRDPRAEQNGVFLDSCPGVTGRPPQSAYDEQASISTPDKRVERGKAVCRNKKCTSAAQEVETDGEYINQRPAQDDGRDPRAEQKGVCVDSCPGVTGRPPQSAYDDQVSISTPDKRVERGKAVCRNKKCTSAAQEIETEGEYTYQRPAQDDGRDRRAGQKRVCVDSCPEGTCKPPQSAYDERDQISTSNKRVEKARVCRNQKCGCCAREVQTDEKLAKKETRLTQTDLKAQEEQLTQTDLQGSRHERLTQTDMGGSRLEILTKNDLQGSQHDGITQTDLQGSQHERLNQNDLQESQYKRLVQTEPKINHKIGSGKSALSGAAVHKADQFLPRQSPNDDKEDVQTVSQKEQKQNQRQDSPSASSRKIYSAQSPSSQKYMKYISRGSLTEQAEQDADAEYRSNSRRYPAKQCQCKPVSSGPSQRKQVLEEPKEQQYLVDDEDIPVGTACPLKKSSPFCDSLPPAAKCDLHPAGCYCDANRKVEKPSTSGRAEHTERSRSSSPTNMKSQQKGPDNTKQNQPYESTYQYSYGRSKDSENVDSSVGTTSNNMDNGPSKVLSKKYVQAHGCDTDCSGRCLSGCNISIDNYLGPQSTSSNLINYQYSNGSAYNPPNQSLVPRLPGLCQFAGAFKCARADNDACKQRMPIFACEKRTRSVTFEDECGKVRAMRNIADNIRSTIDWEQIVKPRMARRDRDTDSTSQSNGNSGRISSTDDDDFAAYTCRTSNSAGTEITCIGSKYEEDYTNYEDDVGLPPSIVVDLPPFTHCPCMLRNYVSFTSICMNDSRSILQEEEKKE